jgi:hypothetical protein
MSKLAQFYFDLEDGSCLRLTYTLQPNPLTLKWIDIVNQRKSELINVLDKSLDLKIANKTLKDIPWLMEKLNNIVKKINNYYDKQLPLFESLTEIDQEILNYLHEEFERYGERTEKFMKEGYPQTDNLDRYPGRTHNQEFHLLWLNLNEWIHITEGAMSTSDYPNFSCLVQYLPFEANGALIDDIDKLFLDSEFNWGELYLGYNTLGKDYMHACHDNDDRIVFNDQVKIQEWLSSEVWLNFSKNHDHFKKKRFELEFYNWWKSLSKIETVPLVDINKLALGRYYLGELKIDDVFLKYHPVSDDWYVENSDLRRRWNEEVFSKIVRATGINIIDG